MMCDYGVEDATKFGDKVPAAFWSSRSFVVNRCAYRRIIANERPGRSGPEADIKRIVGRLARRHDSAWRSAWLHEQR